MDVCVPQRGLPFTKANLAATYAEHAASQVQAMPTAHKPPNAPIPWPDQLTTWYQVDYLHWTPHIEEVQHFVLKRINIYSGWRFVQDVSTSITIHRLTSCFTNPHAGGHRSPSDQSVYCIDNELTLR